MVCSVEAAAWARAGSNALNDDSGMADNARSAEIGGLAADRPIGREDDLLDLHLGLGELLLAVALQQRAALVGADCLVELHLAAFELLDDAFELLQRVFEGQALNILGNCGFFGGLVGQGAPLSGGRRMGVQPPSAGGNSAFPRGL